MKRFYFNTFDHLNSFDIIKGEQVIDLYLKNHIMLGREGHESVGGKNAEPLFNSTHNIDKEGFWNGYPPSYYEIESLKDFNEKGRKGTHFSRDAFAKADVVSMDLSGLNESWTHFIYLELPNILFVNFQDKVHSNPDINIFKQFASEVIENNLSKRETVELADRYDKKYKSIHLIKNYFDTSQEIAWRADLEITQLLSIKEKGLIYPILYPQTHAMFGRGTHRAIIHALLGYDVPIFMQVPKFIDKEKLWNVEMADMFKLPKVTFNIDTVKKQLSFFSNEKKFLESC